MVTNVFFITVWEWFNIVHRQKYKNKLINASITLIYTVHVAAILDLRVKVELYIFFLTLT